MLAGVFQRQKQRGGLLGQFPRALSEERGGETPDQTDCPGHAKHILLRNLVDMAVFVLFCGWLEFSKSCAFGAGAFGAGLAALASQPHNTVLLVVRLTMQRARTQLNW